MAVQIFHTMLEQIETQLRNDILTGKLQPGVPLREKEVSESFGVSRGPVREVFRQLTQQGLLVSVPNKGVRVAPALSDSLRPLIVKLRLDIELFVLDHIFDSIDAKDLIEWNAILKDIETACKENDTAELVKHDLRFHRAFLDKHEDKEIFDIWQPIVLRMLMHYNRLGDLMESFYEHKSIIDAIEAGDKQTALAALKQNIQ